MENVLGEFFGQNGIIALKSEGHSIFPGVKSENFLCTACISDLLGINSCCLLMCLACSLQFPINRKLNNEQIYDTKYIANATVKM